MNDDITPFWEHMPEVLAYPLKGENLIAIGVLSVLGWLTSSLILLGLLVWIATYNFAYGVLSHTAGGNLSPHSGYFDQMGSTIAWKQFALWIILGIPAGMAYNTGGWALAVPVLLAVLAALPVATMALAMDQSLLAALNPLTWMTVTRFLGGRYVQLLWLCGLILGVSALAAWLLSYIPIAGTLASEVVTRCAIVSIFYLLGYVIYQYQDEFGMAVEGPELIREETPEPVADPTVLAAQQLLDEGDRQRASQLLKEAMQEQGPWSPAADALLTLGGELEDVTSQLAVLRLRMQVHLADDEFEQALELWDQAQALDPNFLFPEPDISLTLCKHLLERGESRRSLLLAQGFVRHFPGHKDNVGHAFLAARIFTDKLGRDAEALKILNQMVTRYAKHPQIDQITQERDRVAALVPSDSASPRNP
ncbi:MAG: hypothetical protein AAF358_00260 [Pseudomonadota bacterium]